MSWINVQIILLFTVHFWVPKTTISFLQSIQWIRVMRISIIKWKKNWRKLQKSYLCITNKTMSSVPYWLHSAEQRNLKTALTSEFAVLKIPAWLLLLFNCSSSTSFIFLATSSSSGFAGLVWDHKFIESFKLEGTTKGFVVQLSCNE